MFEGRAAIAHLDRHVAKSYRAHRYRHLGSAARIVAISALRSRILFETQYCLPDAIAFGSELLSAENLAIKVVEVRLVGDADVNPDLIDAEVADRDELNLIPVRIRERADFGSVSVRDA